MAEISFLHFFLFVAFILSPVMTKYFFLQASKTYSFVHITSLIILLVGVVLRVEHTVIVWPIFCVYGLFLYFKSNRAILFSPKSIVKYIPFAFSLISSVWFVAGVYDLNLLGYGREWSFYAALHGAFLGWLLVGCLAFLSGKSNVSKIYQWGCYLSLLFFLLVAFGIDGVPYIKRVGVIGFSLMMPFLIGHYVHSVKKEYRLSKFLAGVSLLSIILSMAIAVLNEFWVGFPKVILGIPTMVVTHGVMNAVIAVPCFFLAIKFDRG